MKNKRFNYIPGFYEKLRYALLKCSINLIAYLARKLKELIYTKIILFIRRGKGIFSLSP